MDGTKVAEQRGLLAAEGVIGALLASSCCILPLVFVTLGISGAWIGTLTALAPYQAFFLVPTFGLLGAGFWAVYFRRKPDCESSYCARPVSDRAVKLVLWIGTTLVVVALALNLLMPLLI